MRYTFPREGAMQYRSILGAALILASADGLRRESRPSGNAPPQTLASLQRPNASQTRIVELDATFEGTDGSARPLRRLARHLVRFPARLRQPVAAQDENPSRSLSGRIRIRRVSLGTRRIALQQSRLHHAAVDVRSLDEARRAAVADRHRDHAQLRKQSRVQRRWRAERSRRLGSVMRRAGVITSRFGPSETKFTGRGSTICTPTRTIRRPTRMRFVPATIRR